MTAQQHQQLITNLMDHVFGSGSPSMELLDRGRFPKNWASRYLSILEKVSSIWAKESAWPREIVAAVHFASFYLDLRYGAWKAASGEDNPNTVQMLTSIRRHSEMFLMSPAIGWGRGAEPE